MPERYFQGSWRSLRDNYGYKLVQVNHYAVKSCESYLVKKMRGRAHHVGESLGTEYWEQMNQNGDEDRTIDMVALRKHNIYDDLMSDPEVARLHQACCDLHRAQIAELRERPDMKDLLKQLVPGTD